MVGSLLGAGTSGGSMLTGVQGLGSGRTEYIRQSTREACGRNPLETRDLLSQGQQGAGFNN